jgi:hypothetical protein
MMPEDEQGMSFGGLMFRWTVDDDSTFIGKLNTGFPSPDGPENVDWLLVERTSGSDKGPMEHITYVVRAETQGGKIPADQDACTEDGMVYKAEYTTFYFFYGSGPDQPRHSPGCKPYRKRRHSRHSFYY